MSGAIRNNLQYQERKQTGNDGEKFAEKVLATFGFTDIKRSQNNTSYDFTAKKDEKPCFVEVKTRSLSAATQFFTYRDSQLRNLAEFDKIGKVFMLLINKFGHRLVTLEDVLNKKVDGVYVFKYKGKTALMQIRKQQQEPKKWYDHTFGIEYITMSLKVPKTIRDDFKALARARGTSQGSLFTEVFEFYRENKLTRKTF